MYSQISEAKSDVCDDEPSKKCVQDESGGRAIASEDMRNDHACQTWLETGTVNL